MGDVIIEILSRFGVPVFICVVLPVMVVWLITRARQNETNRKAEIMIKAIEAGVPVDMDQFKSAKKKGSTSIKQDLLEKLKVLVILLLGCCPAMAREYEVSGPEGGIAFKISLPEGFNPKTDRCPMVILMHGIFSSKDYNPMPALAKGLAQAGIASIRFDFDGHGQSEGRKQDMTIEKELADARAIWEYVRTLPYVDGIGLLGHSQGGVIASMTAGRLSAEGTPPGGLVLIAPGSVIKEACQAGKFFNARFDPANPPEYIRCWGIYKLGREYLLSTQQLDIYAAASAYQGPVRVLHGTRDSIVPMWCSEKFVETYGSKRAELVVVEGENHTISRKRKEVVASVVQFFKDLYRL